MKTNPQPLFETFEQRRLMTVAATVAANTLFIYGDDASNGISVERSGSDILVKKYVGNNTYQTFFKTKDAAFKTLRIQAYGGADTISVAPNVLQRAYINGGAGADWIKAGGGETNVYGHDQYASNDDGAADTLISGMGTAYLYGQKGNDVFYTKGEKNPSTAGKDYLYGGDGKDAFHLDAKRQAYVYGQGGNDTFIPNRQPAEYWGGDGKDTVDYKMLNGTPYGTLINFGNGPVLSGVGGGWGTDRLHSDIEVAYGTNKSDTIFAQAGMTIYGLGGDDLIYGSPDNDNIDGGAGNDVINAGQGNDTVHGGANNDTINGDGGNDKLYGDAGNDQLHAGSGYDRLVGGAGNDNLYAQDGHGADVIFGGNEDGTQTAGTDMAIFDYVDLLNRDFAFNIDVVA